MVESFTPELLRILGQAGFVVKRSGKGDHQIWWHPETGIKVTVDGTIKSRHTANAVLKQAGLPKSF